jgi:hypothetical protein
LRTRGETRPPEPIIKNFHNIECRDAVLAWDDVKPLLDEDGNPVTRWDGRTTKPHPVTGQPVPDETARVPAYRYINPRPAEWPEADFVVGNPPFIGTALMRLALGDGYTEAIRQTYNNVPESVDYVMYWWHKAAKLAQTNVMQRFGFIATNSLRQTFNRRILQQHMEAKQQLSLVFAIPDHPWVDSADGAAVRISMTVGEAGDKEGTLRKVFSEKGSEADEPEVVLRERKGKIQSDLTIGANVTGTAPLKANENLSNRGVSLFGTGFIITPEKAERLGLNRAPGLERYIRHYRNGRDITQQSRDVMVIDLYGLDAKEVQEQYPQVYQHVFINVKPERDQNRRKSRRENWWIFGEPNPKLRDMLGDLERYIATVETSKHRFFVFLDKEILPDNKLVSIALEDAYFLGVLSSRIHITWALAAGSRLGVGNDPVYVKTTCFEKFPFPDARKTQKERIRQLAEELDTHRKRQQAQHPSLTMTDIYNVLEKLRAGEPLAAREKDIHEQGLVSILRQLHDDLDAAVFAAYGWPPTLSDEEILARLVALNAERAAEEARGLIRWLRPDYQAPGAARPQQTRLIEADETETAAEVAATAEKQAWPTSMAEQARAVRAALSTLGGPVTPKQVAATFAGPHTLRRIAQTAALLETLAALGQARELEDGRFTAV